MTTRAPYPYEPPHEQASSAGEEQNGGASRRPAGRRSRLRTLLPLGVAAWVVLEIWLLTLVGQAAGGLTVFALLVAGFLFGSWAIKRAGRRAWGELTDSVQRAQAQAAGQDPDEAGTQSGDGAGDGNAKSGKGGGKKGGNAQAMLGGLLLMVPGLISDAAGLLLLFPPTARLLSRTTRRMIGRRAEAGFAPGGLGDAYQQARRAEEQVRIHRPAGTVVQGEVLREDAPPTR